jgi:hypothetical protein
MSVGSQIPSITELLLSGCGCDVLGDHVSTCTVHSGVKKSHDWLVEQLDDLFRTTHKVKTQQVTRILGNTIDSGIGLSITIDKLRVLINKTLSILSA